MYVARGILVIVMVLAIVGWPLAKKGWNDETPGRFLKGALSLVLACSFGLLALRIAHIEGQGEFIKDWMRLKDGAIYTVRYCELDTVTGAEANDALMIIASHDNPSRPIAIRAPSGCPPHTFLVDENRRIVPIMIVADSSGVAASRRN